MTHLMLRTSTILLGPLLLGALIAACAGAQREAAAPAMAPAGPGETPEAATGEDGPIEITAVEVEGEPDFGEGEDEEVATEEPTDEEEETEPEEDEEGGETVELVAQASSGPPPAPGDEGEAGGAPVSTPPAPGARRPAASPPREHTTDDLTPSKAPPRRVRHREGGRRRTRDAAPARRPPSAPPAPRAGGAPPPPSPAPAPRPAPDAPAAAPAPSADRAAPASGTGGVPAAPYGRPGRVVEQQRTAMRLLTAATVPDVDRRGEYLAYLSRHPGERSRLGLDLSRRVRFRVVDGQGRPIHDAVLTLIGQGFRVEGRTHADGWWDFFPSVSAPQAAGPMTVYIQSGNTNAQATVPIPAQGDGRDIVIRLPQGAAVSPSVLDLAFLIDVTGSMGDELRYVNEEVVGIVSRVRAAVPQTKVRVAATFYRDRQDYVPVEQIPFSTNVRAFESHMRLVQASGGGDYPEDVNLGLASALTTLDWTNGQAVRVLVVIADAPPQFYNDFPYTYHHAMAEASRRGIRILPVAASGSDRVVEYLFRAMGAFTSTPYVYLTDDSGIGGHHMEADTDRVAVEMFSDLLTRLLIADLRGEGMHEPPGVDAPVLTPRQ